MNTKIITVWSDNKKTESDCYYDEDSRLISNADINEIVTKQLYDNVFIQKQYILYNGEKLNVCSCCGEYTLKPVMNPGVEHSLNEELECPNIECEYNEKY